MTRQCALATVHVANDDQIEILALFLRGLYLLALVLVLDLGVRLVQLTCVHHNLFLFGLYHWLLIIEFLLLLFLWLLRVYLFSLFLGFLSRHLLLNSLLLIHYFLIDSPFLLHGLDLLAQLFDHSSSGVFFPLLVA